MPTFSPLSLLKQTTLREIEQVRPRCLVHHLVAVSVHLNGVSVAWMVERMTYQIALAMVKARLSP